MAVFSRVLCTRNRTEPSKGVAKKPLKKLRLKNEECRCTSLNEALLKWKLSRARYFSWLVARADERLQSSNETLAKNRKRVAQECLRLEM